MGRYADWDDVANRYPDIAKLAGSIELGTSWLAGAEDELDARLAARYTVPFAAPVPGLINDLIIDMTYWRATMRQESSAVLKTFIDERLGGLVSGAIALVSSGTVMASSTAPRASVDTAGRHTSFGPDDPIEWETDEDWIEAVEDSRE